MSTSKYSCNRKFTGCGAKMKWDSLWNHRCERATGTRQTPKSSGLCKWGPLPWPDPKKYLRGFILLGHQQKFETQQEVLHHCWTASLCPYHGNNSTWISHSMSCICTHIYTYTHMHIHMQAYVTSGACGWPHCSSQSVIYQNDTDKPTVIQPSGYAIWALNAVHVAVQHVIWALNLDLYIKAVRQVMSTFISWVTHAEKQIGSRLKWWESTMEARRVPAVETWAHNCTGP